MASRSRVIKRRRHQVGKFGDEDFLRRVAHMGRIVDHQRPGMDALEHVRRGDIGEVERRILAQQHHVEGREIDVPRLAQREMVARDIAHLERPHRGRHFAVAQRQPVGRVIGQRVAARLRFQQQREGRIAADIDPLDRVHLHGDVQAHGTVSRRDFWANCSAKWQPAGKVNLDLTSYRQHSRPEREPSGAKYMKLAKLSIAAKLYVIFALLATVTVALAAVAILNANRHVALTREFELGLRRRRERRAHQQPDLRRGDGIARHLHVAGHRRRPRSSPPASTASTTRSAA